MHEQLELNFPKPFDLTVGQNLRPDYSCAPVGPDGVIYTMYIKPYHGRRFTGKIDCPVYLGLGFVFSGESFMIREINLLPPDYIEVWAQIVK